MEFSSINVAVGTSCKLRSCICSKNFLKSYVQMKPFGTGRAAICLINRGSFETLCSMHYGVSSNSNLSGYEILHPLEFPTSLSKSGETTSRRSGPSSDRSPPLVTRRCILKHDVTRLWLKYSTADSAGRLEPWGNSTPSLFYILEQCFNYRTTLRESSEHQPRRRGFLQERRHSWSMVQLSLGQ